MKEVKDFLGKEIKVGDYCAFATRVGNCGKMRICKILAITEEHSVKVKSADKFKVFPNGIEQTAYEFFRKSEIIRTDNLLIIPEQTVDKTLIKLGIDSSLVEMFQRIIEFIM